MYNSIMPHVLIALESRRASVVSTALALANQLTYSTVQIASI